MNWLEILGIYCIITYALVILCSIGMGIGRGFEVREEGLVLGAVLSLFWIAAAPVLAIMAVIQVSLEWFIKLLRKTIATY